MNIDKSFIRNISRVAVFTGAGISAESGIATFRSPDGIWAKFKPEELANVDAFLSNPERVWQWYEHRRKVVNDAEPNAGHRAIVDLERIVDRVDVITQNVDGLHQRAGSSIVHELHGSLMQHRCIDCDTPYQIGDESGVPHCRVCGGLIRPNVVWFGEELPVDVWQRSVEAVLNCDLLISVGTSTIVYPAAGLPFMAEKAGKYVIEVNPERTEFTRYADHYIQGMAGIELPKLVELFSQAKR